MGLFSWSLILFITLGSFFKALTINIFKKPTIIVSCQNDMNSYQLSSNYLREWPLFKLFNESFFNQNLLPNGSINYRNDLNKYVDSSIIEKLLEELIREVQSDKNKFSGFIILRDRTFNKKLKTGLITLKFKDYPFVVKLFIETPYSFTNPFKMGLEAYLYFLTGGVNRHTLGFSRIKNLQYVKEKIAKNNEWLTIIDTPRKWFWLPMNNSNIEITGYNIGSSESCKISMPSIYCIIADFIEAEHQFKTDSIIDFLKMDKRARAAMKDQACKTMPLCNYLNLSVDPNIDNFITEAHTQKLVIIDTEHYPSFGIKNKPKSINSYAYLSYFIFKEAVRNILLPDKQYVPFDMKS